MASKTITIKRPDGAIIALDVPYRALFRFSGLVQAMVPKYPSLMKHEKLALAIPVLGNIAAHPLAGQYVLNYMVANMDFRGEKLPAFKAKDSSNVEQFLDFLQMVQIAAVCKDMGVRPKFLVEQIHADAMAKFEEDLGNDLLQPGTVTSMLSFLPQNHYIARTVIRTLTTRWIEGTSTDRENEVTNQVWKADQAIQTLFDQETEQQLASRRRWVARKKSLANAATKKNDESNKVADESKKKIAAIEAQQLAAAQKDSVNTADGSKDKKTAIPEKKVVVGAYYTDISSDTHDTKVKKTRRNRGSKAKAQTPKTQDPNDESDEVSKAGKDEAIIADENRVAAPEEPATVDNAKYTVAEVKESDNGKNLKDHGSEETGTDGFKKIKPKMKRMGVTQKKK